MNATHGNMGYLKAGARRRGRGVTGAWFLSAVVLLFVAAGGAWGLHFTTLKKVQIVVESGDSDQFVEFVALETRARTVGEALDAAGIVLLEGDEVAPPLEVPLASGDEIRVARARRAYVNVDGRQVEVTLAKGTVRDALVAADVRMGPLDRVQPVRETPLEDGMEITVIRVVQEEVEERETIPFATLEWADPHLSKGETRVLRDGREGILVRRVLLTYENGELAARRVVSNEVVQEAIARIIGIGTREAAANVLQTESGTYRYVKVIELEATAYYPGPESTGEWADGYTYTGLRAGKGVVAVDPNVIELGTRMYIPGYGEAIAADIGGAIKGNRIDLGFDTLEEALRFGRKMITAYILAD